FFDGNTQIASNANGVAGPNGLSLGAALGNPASEPSKGDVAEVLIFRPGLTDAQRAQIVGYLRAKWLGVLNPAGNAAVASGATADLNGVNATVGPLSGAGTVTLGGATLTVNSTASSSFGGAITGTGNLVKNGSANLTLTGTNTYNGSTIVNAGSLIAR